MFLRKLHKICAFSVLVFLPGALAASAWGFLHGQRAVPLDRGLMAATSAAPVCDGGSVAFEFALPDEGPLWVLLQNTPRSRTRRQVLVSRTPGFESYVAVRGGSVQEKQLLASLRALGARCEDDARVQGNLRLLESLIARRTDPSPSENDWFFY